MNRLNKRPLVMLTLNLGETYNHLLEQASQVQKQRTYTTDEKGYFVAYEN